MWWAIIVFVYIVNEYMEISDVGDGETAWTYFSGIMREELWWW